jgi:hypothetical protein
MDDNFNATTPIGGRRPLPADVGVDHDISRQASLIPLRSRRGVALITATVLASMAGFLEPAS